MTLLLIASHFISVVNLAGSECNACGIEDARAFIDRSGEFSASERRADPILDALKCIAVHCFDESGAALNAMFHLSPDSKTTQRLLVDVIVDPDVQRDEVRSYGARLLLTVLDEEGCTRLRSEVTRGWGREAVGSAFWALVEYGDVGILPWIEGQIAVLPDTDIRKRWMSDQAEMIRIQGDVGSMLRTLRNGGDHFSPVWLTRHASRAGASREQLREAVLGYVERTLAKDASMEFRELRNIGFELDILRDSDNIPASQVSVDRHRPRPEWAIAHQEAELRFWRGEREIKHRNDDK